MALSGRFRSDTRTMRMERLHGPKGGHSGPRRAFSRGKGEAASGGPGRAGAVSARADVEGNSWRMTATSAALVGSRVRPGLEPLS